MINNAAHFIFDSNHIDDIESRLYGFYTTKNGLFTETIPSEDITDATGAWVLVRRTPEQIEITQDSIGCFGLFLYRHRKYWALSNSFNHLLDYLGTTTGHHTYEKPDNYGLVKFILMLLEVSTLAWFLLPY